jgi:hypothetical protein
VIPIIDLMAASNAHFRKLRDFITLQLPAGFPVKIGKTYIILSEVTGYSLYIRAFAPSSHI